MIDSTMDFVSDNLGNFIAPMFVQGERKIELLFELKTKHLPTFLKQIERRLIGKKFVCGDRITCADFQLGSLLCSAVGNKNNPNYYATNHVLKAYPAVMSYIENFKHEMRNYLAARLPAPL